MKEKRRYGKSLVLGAGLVIAVFAVVSLDLNQLLRGSLDWISGLGTWGPIAFVFFYVAAFILFLAGSLLTLGGGFVFGVLKGSLFGWISAIFGASVSFLIGRYLARDWVTKKIEGHEGFKRIDEAIAEEGWKIVGLTRLSPGFPFNLLNYSLVLTKLSFRDYFFASCLGMRPGTLMYVYLGSFARDLVVVGQTGQTRSSAEWTLYVTGLLGTLAVTVYITRIARRALDRRIA